MSARDVAIKHLMHLLRRKGEMDGRERETGNEGK
jgi:hypothetical protein